MHEQPDLILWAGDYIQAPPDARPASAARRTPFCARSSCTRRGALAVRGNVDKGDFWATLFDNLPVRVVQRTESFDLGDDLRLTCLAVSDSFDYGLKLPAPPRTAFIWCWATRRISP